MDQENNQKSISKLPLASAAAWTPDQMSEHQMACITWEEERIGELFQTDKNSTIIFGFY